MQFIKHDIKYKKHGEWLNVIPLGDCHIGNSGCDINALKSMVEWIRSKPNTYWIGMGDYIDAINYSDKRFDPKTIDSKYISLGDIDKTIQLQIEDFIDIIRPIKDKCLGFLRGNHEETIRRYFHYDVLYEIAKELDIPRKMLLYDAACIRLRCVRMNSSHMYDIFCMHGNVGGRSYGHKANRIQDLHKYFLGDIYLLAHSHIKQAQMNTLIYFNKSGKMEKKKIIDAYTGCFLRGYERNKTCYVEKWMYPPTDIGCIKIKLQPESGDKHVSL